MRNSIYESFGEPATPIVYFSYRDRPSYAGEIHVRARPGTETTLAADVRRVVREIDTTLPIYDVRTLSEHVERNLFLRRVPARMFVVLGPLLLALAAIGIYAVVAYGVAQRTREIGLRLALGAQRRRVVAAIVQDTLRSVAIGAVPGWLIMYVIADPPGAGPAVRRAGVRRRAGGAALGGRPGELGPGAAGRRGGPRRRAPTGVERATGSRPT